MKKWLFRIIWIPAFVMAALFLVANRQIVRVSLDPFNAEAPALSSWPMPLWAWLMLTLLLGFAAGAVGAWSSARPTRVAARQDRKELKRMRMEVTHLQTRIRELSPNDASIAPQMSDKEPPLLKSENA